MQRVLAYFGLATLVGLFFMWLAVRDLPLDQVAEYARTGASGSLLWAGGAFLGIFGVSHTARVMRWYELVRPLGDVDPWTVHRACTVGFMAILLLPLRLGELVRPYLLSKRCDHGMSELLGTAVVERVIDGLVVTGLLFVTLALYDGDQSTAFARGTGLVSAVVFVSALLVCLAAVWRKEATIGFLEKVGNLVSAALTRRALGLLDAFIDGFRALASGGALGRFLGVTAVYWATNVGSMWVLARWGFGLDVSYWQMSTVMSIVVVGIMIPAGPGMAGNFEFFMLRGLALFMVLEGAVAGRAAMFSATVHLLQLVVIVAPGLVVMWLDPEARHLVRLSQGAERAVETGSES